MDSTAFLNAIFRDAPQDGRKLVIWTHPDKATRQFEDAASAAAYGSQRRDDANVYFGLSLMSGVVDGRGRGKYENTAAIGCLWADIDIAGGAHKKKNLPRNLKSARELLDRVGLEPSILVHSGHGLQAYWLLNETWVFESDEERKKAASLASGWVSTIRAIAACMDYDADSVGDLTRVFRLPGTLNHKDPAKSVEVRILESNDLRYSWDDFDPFLIAPEFEPPEQGSKKKVLSPVMVDAVKLDPKAEPPALKMMALMENDLKFKRAWKRARTDLQDQSASSYDMSLANIAVLAGWDDQEVANLIISWRREHKEDLEKALRRDYIMRTIAKAKACMNRDQALASLAQEAEKIIDVPVTGDGNERQKILKELSKLLGIGIQRWIQHGRENARYSLELVDGRLVRMGTTNEIMTMRTFRNKLYEATRILIQAKKTDEWDNIVRILGQVAEVIENEEASSAYQAQQWVAAYLSDHPPCDGEEWQESAAANEPFIREGRIHIHAGELRRHMRVLQHEHTITHVELCDCLKVCSFSRTSMSVRHEGRTICRSFWTSDQVDRFTGIATQGKAAHEFQEQVI